MSTFAFSYDVSCYDIMVLILRIMLRKCWCHWYSIFMLGVVLLAFMVKAIYVLYESITPNLYYLFSRNCYYWKNPLRRLILPILCLCVVLLINLLSSHHWKKKVPWIGKSVSDSVTEISWFTNLLTWFSGPPQVGNHQQMFFQKDSWRNYICSCEFVTVTAALYGFTSFVLLN